MMLELYYKYCSFLSKFSSRSMSYTDLMTEFTADMTSIFGKLDPSIRSKLRKRGIKVTHTTNAGFDTEYQRLEMDRNRLLSAQLAVSCTTLVEVPTITEYKFVKIDPLGSKKSDLEFNLRDIEKQLINFECIERDINMYLNFLRDVDDKDHTHTLNIISNILRSVGIKSIIDPDRESETFILDNTPIHT